MQIANFLLNHIKFSWRQGLLAAVLFKELLKEFDVLIGHVRYGVGVGAVEVDEP